MGIDWHIINQNDYRLGGDVHVLGEIYNQTGNTLWIASMQITFHSGDETTVFNAPTEVTLLPHGRKIAFHANAGPVTYDSYTLDMEYVTMPPGLSRTDLGITGNSMILDNGVYRIRGEVENQGAELTNYAQVVATLFDGGGRVAGVSSALIRAGELAPGQRKTFEVLIRSYGSDVTSYEVQVFGF